MKYFFLTAPFFHQLPIAITEELRKIDPKAQFCGLSTGSRDVFDNFSQKVHMAETSFHWLDDLEQRWIRKADSSNQLERLINTYGTKGIRRLIMSDRQLGGRYLFDAVPSKTQLHKLCENDQFVVSYVEQLLTWTESFLKTESPDIVFCYTVAGAPAYAIALVCKQLKIPFRRISSTHIENRYVIEDSIHLALGSVSEHFQNKNANALDKESYRFAQTYLENFRTKPQKYHASARNHEKHLNSYTYPAIFRRTASDLRNVISYFIKRYPIELRKTLPITRLYENFRKSLSARSYLDQSSFFYNDLSNNNTYVYFPLQVSPEASTMVLSPYHCNQLSIIEALSKAIPVNHVLLLKEHIPMLGKRPSDFYAKISTLPNVRFCHPLANPFQLIRHSALTVSITGTATFEAILLGQRAMAIGSPHFVDVAPERLKCPNIAELEHAIPIALSQPPIEDHKLILYLAAIFEHSFTMPPEIYRTNVTRKQVEKHIDVAKTIAKLLFDHKRLI